MTSRHAHGVSRASISIDFGAADPVRVEAERDLDDPMLARLPERVTRRIATAPGLDRVFKPSYGAYR